MAYDPETNTFHLIPGDSNTVYLNDRPSYIPERLAPYDVIRMGQTKLVFVPLCGDRFSWSSGLSTDVKVGSHEA